MTQLEQLWQARYGRLPDHQPAAELAGLLQHRSVRAWLNREVGDGVLRDAIAAAQSASTSSHLQAWSVIAIRDRSRLRRLAGWAGDQEHVAQAPLFLVWLVDWSRLQRMGARAEQPCAGVDFLEGYTLGVIDAALAAQNASVFLESQGLGIVYIGGLRNQPEAVASELALPPGSFAVFGMCVGYPDPAQLPAIKPRLPPELILHEERYTPGADEDRHIAAYDQLMHDYQKSSDRPSRTWSLQSLARMRDAGSLTGRHRLRQALLHLGFQLR